MQCMTVIVNLTILLPSPLNRFGYDVFFTCYTKSCGIQSKWRCVERIAPPPHHHTKHTPKMSISWSMEHVRALHLMDGSSQVWLGLRTLVNFIYYIPYSYSQVSWRKEKGFSNCHKSQKLLQYIYWKTTHE